MRTMGVRAVMAVLVLAAAVFVVVALSMTGALDAELAAESEFDTVPAAAAEEGEVIEPEKGEEEAEVVPVVGTVALREVVEGESGTEDVPVGAVKGTPVISP
jgi:hypothetical protein